MLARSFQSQPDLAAMRGAARHADRGLEIFTRQMFYDRKGYRWVNNHHHYAIFAALTRVFKGQCKRLIINIPPRYSKTEIAVINFIAWALGQKPDSEFIHVSYAANLAMGNSAQTRDIVTSDLYRTIFPDVRIRADSNSKGDWRTSSGGVVYAQGAGGTITGFGAGKIRDGFGGAIIIDDPHKADEARSDVMRKNVIEWFGNTLESRKNSPHTPIIVIMQRLHEADLAGFLLAGGNGEVWEHVTLPAIQADGTALWPAKHSIETLRGMERASPYVFAGQYQQRPAPMEGGEFKPAMIEAIDAVPAGCRFARAWDLAGTKNGGDYTAGALLGVMPDGRYLIGGMERFQEGPEVVEVMVRSTAARDGTGVNVYIPQDPGQAGKAQLRALVRALAGFSAGGKPVSGDKVTRARPLAAQVNIGNVVMLRGAWNAALIEEMRNFPNGKNDDQIDALSLAFDALTDNKLGILDFYKAEADEAKALQGAAKAETRDTTGFLRM